MTTTFSTPTYIAAIVDVSTYESWFSYDGLWGSDAENEQAEGRLVCDDYDSDAVKKRIVHEVNHVLASDKPLKDYGVVSIKATRFKSPPEYNFMTDWLDLEVEVDASFPEKAKAAILAPQNRKAIVAYCADNWVTRDGYLSSMLNRVSYLSRDYWRHGHYGTPISTDAEIEAALVADLNDAVDHLANGTGNNDSEEIGVLLALLWLIEYPSDFRDGEMPWITERVYEHMRGNSSLSEFCTVLDRDEVRAKFGPHLVDFDGYLADEHKACEKYRSSAVKDRKRAKAVSETYEQRLAKAVGELQNEQDVIIINGMPDEEKVCRELDELRDKWADMLKSGFAYKLWKA